MVHADRFVTRIHLPSRASPTSKELDPLRIGQNVLEVLESDLAAELEARSLYLEAAKYCDGVQRDRVSKKPCSRSWPPDRRRVTIDFLEGPSSS